MTNESIYYMIWMSERSPERQDQQDVFREREILGIGSCDCGSWQVENLYEESSYRDPGKSFSLRWGCLLTEFPLPSGRGQSFSIKLNRLDESQPPTVRQAIGFIKVL